MPLYEYTSTGIRPIQTTNFAAERIRERGDIQAHLRDQIDAIAPDCMVLAEEFGDWEDSKRRIDLLCIDKDANLVVVELKRTEDGGAMELQALRYAAMVSTMTFEQAVRAHDAYRGRRGLDGDAQEAILDFLGWAAPEAGKFADDVRIVLVSADFSREMTTAVLWLNQRELDIRCVQMQPYKHGDRILLDIQQVLPLKEAEEYQVRVRAKEREERVHVSARDRTKYNVILDGVASGPLHKRTAALRIVRHLCSRGRTPGDIQAANEERARLWLSVEGDANASEFVRRASAAAVAQGRSFDPTRWFCDEGQLIYSGGRTYALTSQGWTGNDPTIGLLAKAFTSDGLTVVTVNAE